MEPKCADLCGKGPKGFSACGRTGERKAPTQPGAARLSVGRWQKDLGTPSYWTFSFFFFLNVSAFWREVAAKVVKIHQR